jgi:hypothetical protein
VYSLLLVNVVIYGSGGLVCGPNWAMLRLDMRFIRVTATRPSYIPSPNKTHVGRLCVREWRDEVLEKNES